jgi:hypothetical protein
MSILQAGSSEQRRTVAHHSRLSKTLAEVLTDKGALGYFIQYLEAHGGFTLIKFWLDVESFKAAAGARDCTDVTSRKVPVQDHDETKLCLSRCEHDKLSLSTDSGSVFESPLHSSGSINDISVRNICTGTPDEGQETVKSNLSLYQPPNISLTYNESPVNLPPSAVPNSRVSSSSDLNYGDHCSSTFVNHIPSNFCSSESAVTSDNCNKLLHISKSETDNTFSNCTACDDESVSERTSASSKDGTTKSLSVGSSQVTQATVDDALRIFNKYISHEATHPIKFPDAARDRVVAAICSDVGMVDAESFTELQGFVFQTMEKE